MKYQAWENGILRRIGSKMTQSPNNRLVLTDRVPNNLHENLSGKKHAAILVPLCNRLGQPSILFTLRTGNVGTHKNQVSFPGGHINEGETPIDASIREAYEELGQDIGQIDVLGLCQTVPAITGTLVTPVVGMIRNDINFYERFSPSSLEVERVFTRTLDELLDSGNNSSELLSRNGREAEMPIFGVQRGDERIWGLTALVLKGVLENGILPALSDV